jgi:hypothetical protein
LLILVELLITTFSVDIGGIVDHHFLCWYWWNSWSLLSLLILVELLITTFCWYWWNCWLPLSMLILVELLITTFFVDIGGIVDQHFLCWFHSSIATQIITTCTIWVYCTVHVYVRIRQGEL